MVTLDLIKAIGMIKLKSSDFGDVVLSPIQYDTTGQIISKVSSFIILIFHQAGLLSNKFRFFVFKVSQNLRNHAE